MKQKKLDWFAIVMDAVPNNPDNPNTDMWGNGNELLCKTEDKANKLIEVLERLYRSQGENVTLCSGYYDPIEDQQNGLTDEYTGWWYVSLE